MSDVRRITVRVLAGCAALAAGSSAAVADLPITDPTRPPYRSPGVEARGPALDLRLNSTQVSKHSQSAVINGRAVTVGDRIGGAVVTSIRQAEVRLRRGADEVVLRLLLPPVKKPAGADR